MILDEDVRTQWSLEEGQYRVLQVRLKEVPILYFGSPQSRFMNILRDFLEEYDLSAEVSGRDTSLLRGQNYEICGLGRGLILLGGRAYFFGESSTEFPQMHINGKHLEELVEHNLSWAINGKAPPRLRAEGF